MEKITAQHPNSQSLNVVNENIEKLKAFFPTIIKEGKLDVEELKALLGDYVETNDEYYRFTWAGKAMAREEANKPSTATLRPNKAESKDWDTTENIFIEGDNLEVLKLLQKSYANQIKMIYIDPPYNTGKDFVYKDNYADNLGNYLALTGQTDEEGKKLSTNSETDGRYHSNWLNMIYPRLRLARNLMTDDGVIFISIDDNEIQNLRKICDEVFGEENLIAQFVWASEGNTDNQYTVKVKHEYVLSYIKSIKLINEGIGRVIDPNTRADSNLWKGYADNNINKNNPENPPQIIELPVGFPADVENLIYEKKSVDEDFFRVTKAEKYISENIKEQYKIEKQSGLPIKLDDLIIEDYKLNKACRIYGGFANSNKLNLFIRNEFSPVIDDDGSPISFYINRNGAVRYRKEVKQPRNIVSVLQNLGTTEKTRTELLKLGVNFSYPKPNGLIKYLISIGAQDKNSIILDFFAGSGTTAHATMQLNLDGGQRKYICIQLPEKLGDSPLNKKNRTIADITKERIRLAGENIKSEIKKDLFSDGKTLDIGFKAFKLDSSNINAWDGSVENFEQNLFNSADNIKTERTEDDVLYEILLKNGLNLTLPIATKIIADKTVYGIGAGALFICLADNITTNVAEGIGKWKEELAPVTCKVIFKDNGFSDVDKTNSIQILKRYSITEVNSI